MQRVQCTVSIGGLHTGQRHRAGWPCWQSRVCCWADLTCDNMSVIHHSPCRQRRVVYTYVYMRYFPKDSLPTCSIGCMAMMTMLASQQCMQCKGVCVGSVHGAMLVKRPHHDVLASCCLARVPPSFLMFTLALQSDSLLLHAGSCSWPRRRTSMATRTLHAYT